MIPAHAITGLVLAGGQGRRMGGTDKGLQPFEGQPLALRALERLRPQVGALMISANRNPAVYGGFGAPVWSDDALGAPAHAACGFEGPLGGLLVGLTHCRTPWLLAVPCDAPYFPDDLAEKLGAGLDREADDADDAGTRRPPRMAVAWGRDANSPGDSALHPQPVFCLMHTRLRAPLAAFLAGGGRQAGAWARAAGALRVDFDRPGRDELAFANVNSESDLRALTRR